MDIYDTPFSYVLFNGEDIHFNDEDVYFNIEDVHFNDKDVYFNIEDVHFNDKDVHFNIEEPVGGINLVRLLSDVNHLSH